LRVCHPPRRQDSFRVIVPRELSAKGCEIVYEADLLDIGIDLGDLLTLNAVVDYL